MSKVLFIMEYQKDCWIDVPDEDINILKDHKHPDYNKIFDKYKDLIILTMLDKELTWNRTIGWVDEDTCGLRKGDTIFESDLP
jgi:hypothetical protein